MSEQWQVVDLRGPVPLGAQQLAKPSLPGLRATTTADKGRRLVFTADSMEITADSGHRADEGN